ncbi:MAG: MBL fold metallo-hydrolase [Deltaproteobacteria bacterium]|nr:MBL fold metallo-hydrolase [Deltaproteobacteria bacterium]
MATKEESKPYAAPAAYPKEADNAEMLSTLNIIAFDIGQGDSTLVISPEGEAVLIDTGPYGSWNSKISPYLTENPQINLEYLIITHSDNDHDGDVEASGLEPYAVSAGDVINLGENVYLSILAADCAFTDGSKAACDEKDDNAHSTVILIEYGNFKYLTTGDLPGGGGKPPYDTIDLETKIGELAGDVDILHAGHHGSCNHLGGQQ